jgi:hypothetical protein
MKSKFVSGALLIALLAVFTVMISGGAADAGGKPAWLKTSWTCSLVQTGKDSNKSDYYSIKISVNHTNENSDERVIKSIYKKSVAFSATLGKILWVKQSGKAVKYTLTSEKVNDVDIWPGNSYSLVYYIPVNKLISPGGTYSSNLGGQSPADWYHVNSQLKDKGIGVFTNRRMSYDCYVRTKK